MPVQAADQILDAARATVLDFGVSRTTVAEVARRAGLSRMTVYRRYPDGAALMRALMTREFGALLADAQAQAAGATTARERLVQAAIITVDGLMTAPLMLRLLELEPELLLPYLTERVGRFQQLARAAVSAAIVDGQEDGSIRGGHPGVLAATCEYATRGFVLAARSLNARHRATALSELGALLDAYLRP
jgi:AcrR family transcriptional regulator